MFNLKTGTNTKRHFVSFSEEYEDKSRKEFFGEDDSESEADCAVEMYNFGKKNSSKSKGGNPGRVLDTAKILERVFDLEGGRILLKVFIFSIPIAIQSHSLFIKSLILLFL